MTRIPPHAGRPRPRRPALVPALAVAAILAAPLGARAAEVAPARPLFRVLEHGKWGFIDAKGKVVIPPSFERAGEFAEGLAPVLRDGVHAYVDARGAVALVPRHAPAGPVHRPFSEGLAVVRAGGRQAYMDRAGALAFGRTFERADDFSGGYALVCGDGAGCGFIDRAGNAVAGPGFRGGYPSRGGLACAVEMQMMGRVRVALHRVPDGARLGQFDGCGPLSEGLVAVSVDGLWGYVDARGDGVLPPAWLSAGEFVGGLAPVGDAASGRCGYVRRDGTFAIAPRYRTCGSFREGLARVDLAGALEAERVAFVDAHGVPVVVGAAGTPPFDAAHDFANGLAAVGAGGDPAYAAPGGPRLGYVDAKGRYVWTPRN